MFLGFEPTHLILQKLHYLCGSVETRKLGTCDKRPLFPVWLLLFFLCRENNIFFCQKLMVCSRFCVTYLPLKSITPIIFPLFYTPDAVSHRCVHRGYRPLFIRCRVVLSDIQHSSALLFAFNCIVCFCERLRSHCYFSKGSERQYIIQLEGS